MITAIWLCGAVFGLSVVFLGGRVAQCWLTKHPDHWLNRPVF